MSTTQIVIDSWPLQYDAMGGYQGLNTTVPSLRAQVDFTADCPNGVLTKADVTLLNSSVLQVITNTVQHRYQVPVSNAVNGQTYVTMVEVVVSGIVVSVEVQHGVCWPNCASPRNQWGVPCFGFQGRSTVQFTSMLNYFEQTWSNATGWSAFNPKPAYSDPAQTVTMAPSFSHLDQPGSKYSCGNCLQMPAGAGRNWAFAPSKITQVYPIPAVPAGGGAH